MRVCKISKSAYMLLTELHQKLQSHLKEQEKNWNSFIYGTEHKGFYQGFKEIKIEGARSSEKRFNDYDLIKFLSKEKTVLDIGSNCGFLTLLISKHVKDTDGVEINPYLISISNDVKDYLGINNVNFYNKSFEEFSTSKKYDLICSFANDSTFDKNTKFNFQEYIEKIISLLEENGILIFESQAMDMMHPTKFLPKFNFLNDRFKILKYTKVKSEYPKKIKKRFFLVCKKIS